MCVSMIILLCWLGGMAHEPTPCQMCSPLKTHTRTHTFLYSLCPSIFTRTCTFRYIFVPHLFVLLYCSNVYDCVRICVCWQNAGAALYSRLPAVMQRLQTELWLITGSQRDLWGQTQKENRQAERHRDIPRGMGLTSAWTWALKAPIRSKLFHSHRK